MPPATATAAFVESHLRSTLLGRQGEEALQNLRSVAQLHRFEVPTLLCAAGMQPAHLYYVVEGSVELVARRASGDEFVISYVGSGGWATWLNCFMETPADYDFYSSAGATLIGLPVSDVRRFCERHPQVYPAIIQHIGRRMRLVLEWTGQSAMARPAQRMAKLLHVMAMEQQPATNHATVRLTQARLASMARCSRQTANALIAELQSQGLVEPAYGRYDLPDLQKLVAFASQE
jgi:CRP-like cAMP-binding protein